MKQKAAITIILGIIVAAIFAIAGLVAIFDYRGKYISALSPDGFISPAGLEVVRLSGFVLLAAAMFLSIILWQHRRLAPFVRVCLKTIDSAPEPLWIAVLVLIALVLRLAWAIYSPSLPVSDFAEYYNWALQIYRGQTYSYPEGMGCGTVLVPSAFKPPGLPLFLSAVFKLFGPSLLALKISQAFLGASIPILAMAVIKKSSSRLIARIASLLLVFYPVYIFSTSLIGTEQLFTVILLLAIYFYIMAWTSHRIFRLVMAGMLLGLGALVKPQALFLPLFLVAGMAWSQRTTFYRLLEALILLILSAYLVTVPWQWRNQQIFHYWNVIANDGGVTFFWANTPRGMDKSEDLKRFWWKQGFNEHEIDRQFYREGLKSLKEHPVWVLKNVISYKLKRFFSLIDEEWVAQYNLVRTFREVKWKNILFHLIMGSSAFGYSLIFAFAVYGLVAARPFSSFDKICISIFLYWVFTVSIFHGAPRFRYPLIPVYAYFAGVGILSLLSRVCREGTKGASQDISISSKSESVRRQ